MTIVVTGGGSGGHITPILAVAHELKRLQPEVRIVYIGQRGDRLADVPAGDPNIDAVYTIYAGKFRRYHGEGIKQIFDIPTLLKNLRDLFLVAAGLLQSWRLLGKLRPDCVFVKGGFVGVPVGLSAAARHIPYVTHDSDALPGLANRIIARWAALHAVALPKEVYAYPARKTVTVGVPVHASFQPVDAADQAAARAAIGLGQYHKIMLVTGGGLGAARLNRAIATAVPALLTAEPELAVVHLAGRAHEQSLQQQYEKLLPAAEQGRVKVIGYTTDLVHYSAAADVVVTRAGATSLAEFAVQGKACIIVPNPVLTGGHQVKNAEYLAAQQAAIIVTDAAIKHDGEALRRPVEALLADAARRRELAQNLQTFVRPDAARELAKLILQQASPVA